MTATYAQTKAALGVALQRIPGLRVYPDLTGDINPPAAVIAPGTGTFLQYDTSAVSDDLTLTITLFVQWGEDRSADGALSAYLERSGDLSILAAVNDDPTLGGVVDSAQVNDVSDWGVFTFAARPLLGCVFGVDVLL